MSLAYNRIVIKIGSNVLTQDNGLPDLARIAHLVDQISAIKKQGKEVIVVSSGEVRHMPYQVPVQPADPAMAATPCALHPITLPPAGM